jgi:hypothetical protein
LIINKNVRKIIFLNKIEQFSFGQSNSKKQPGKLPSFFFKEGGLPTGLPSMLVGVIGWTHVATLAPFDKAGVGVMRHKM